MAALAYAAIRRRPLAGIRLSRHFPQRGAPALGAPQGKPRGTAEAAPPRRQAGLSVTVSRVVLPARMLRVALRHQVDVEYLLVVLLPPLGACQLMRWFTLSSREGLRTLLDGEPTSLEPCKSGAYPHHGASLHISRIVCPGWWAVLKLHHPRVLGPVSCAALRIGKGSIGIERDLVLGIDSVAAPAVVKGPRTNNAHFPDLLFVNVIT